MKVRGLARVALSLLLIAGITLGMHEIRVKVGTVADYVSTSAGADVLVEIPEGATGSQIARILFDRDVVKSSESFFQVAVGDPRSSRIAPGVHRLQMRISARDALTQLLDSTRIPGLVTVPEGSWRSEILSTLATSGFTIAALSKALKSLSIPRGFSAREGVFFPAQYSFPNGTTEVRALQAMVDRFATEVSVSGLSAGRDGFSPLQLLTIASLIQAEGDEVDFGKISQVIRNRLKLGMPLQLDTTVHYIKHTRGQIFLSAQSTQLASPYNTYLHYGLPPGPIGNPGRAAMEASMNPTMGDWIFFITVKPGDTRFTASNGEFLRWKSEYEKNYRAELFGKK